MYIVYKTTNLINDKFYIGVHKQNSDVFDGYLGSNSILKKAIKKYGKKNFIRKTLFVFESKEDAFDIESLLICENICDRNDVYNIKPGGKGNCDLGKDVVTKKIGIHALSFEERSNHSKINQVNRHKDERKLMCSIGGKKGGETNRKLNKGIFSLSSEQRIENGKKAIEKQRKEKTGFFSEKNKTEISVKGGRLGGKATKGFLWYHDNKNSYKYTIKQQEELSFNDFIKENTHFSPGRPDVPYKERPKQKGKRFVTNGLVNQMLKSFEEAEIFLQNNPTFKYGKTHSIKV